MPVDARTHLASLVGRPSDAFGGMTVTVIDVQESVAVVRTRRADGGEHVQADHLIRIEWVQRGIDRLLSGGEVEAPMDAFGHLVEIVFILLLRLPGAQLISDPPRIVLSDRRHWSLLLGDAVRRTDLHGRFGGDSRTRISPSATTPNVFIFLEPGYEESVLRDGGVLHVPGNVIRGSALSTANRAVLGHHEAGRALRVFAQSGADLVYVGEFELDPGEPFYFTDIQGSTGAPERRIVFRLRQTVRKIVGAPGWALGGASDAGVVTVADPDEPHAVVAPTNQSADRSVRHLPGSASVAEAPAAPSRRARLLLDHARQGLHFLGARGAWPPLLLCSCVAVALTTWGWTLSPVRPAVTTWFLLICPGMALMRLLPSRGAMMRLVLAVATSLALETLVAEAALEAKAWSPGTTLGLLIALVVAATAVDLRAAASRSVPAARPRAALRDSRGG